MPRMPTGDPTGRDRAADRRPPGPSFPLSLPPRSPGAPPPPDPRSPLRRRRSPPAAAGLYSSPHRSVLISLPSQPRPPPIHRIHAVRVVVRQCSGRKAPSLFGTQNLGCQGHDSKGPETHRFGGGNRPTPEGEIPLLRLSPRSHLRTRSFAGFSLSKVIFLSAARANQCFPSDRTPLRASSARFPKTESTISFFFLPGARSQLPLSRPWPTGSRHPLNSLGWLICAGFATLKKHAPAHGTPPRARRAMRKSVPTNEVGKVRSRSPGRALFHAPLGSFAREAGRTQHTPDGSSF